MAKKKGHGRHGKKAIPLAPIAPAVGLAMVSYASAGGFNKTFVDKMSTGMIGYSTASGKLSVASALPFWGGEVAGIVVHKVANKVGVNNHLRRLTMGYLEL